MERCGFFDANLVGEEYDRTYLAEQFASYFASFIGNGVFGGKLSDLHVVAMANPSMQIIVSAGQAWINGYWYENTDDMHLPIDVADGVLNRIDSVVLRLGFAERDMWLAVRKGTPSANPIAPELVRNADYYELQLATISVKAGALNVKTLDITDTRLNASVCGFVTGLINQIDTTEYGRLLDSFIKRFEIENTKEINEVVARLKRIAETNDISSLIIGLAELQETAFLTRTDENGVNSLNASTNFDSIIESGIYWCNTWEGGTLNATAPNKRDTGWLIVHSNSTKCMVQTYYSGKGIIKNRAKDEETDNFGEWEFVNPPMVPGIEYRTIERWDEKPVYKKLIYVSAMPNAAVVKINTGATWDRIISVNGYMLDATNMDYYTLPATFKNRTVPSAYIAKIGSDGSVELTAIENLSHMKGYILLKYTKG